MTKSLKNFPVHPFLCSLYPVLELYSLNAGLFPMRDVFVPLLVVLIGTILYWVILGLILRSLERAAVGASLSVIFFFLFGHMWDLVLRSRPAVVFFNQQRDNLISVWAILFLIALVLGCWKWKRPERLTSAMNVGAVALVAVPAISILLSWIGSWRGTSIHLSFVRSADLQVTERPDIYYIILDGYGRTDSLKRVIGLDNAWFVKGLTDRGFFVATDSHSNYCQTELSLSSSLNLDYLQTLLPKEKRESDDRLVFDRMIDRNQVAAYLRQIGYRYEAVTTGFPAVHPRSADLLLDEDPIISLFEGTLIDETPIPRSEGVSESMFVARRDLLYGAIQNLENMAVGGIQPRFIFAHILAPHPPFVFGANGEPRRPKHMGFTFMDASDFMANGGTPAEYQQGYKEQATYLSKRILEMVDRIRSKSAKPPVIILQGDHGSKLRMDQVHLGKSDVNECFPNLCALFVPASVRPNLYDGITPVNEFRMLFNGLFHDHFERLPDRSFYSSWLTPFDFTDVTKRIKPSGR